MSELNRDQIISEIEMKIKYARFIDTNAVVLSAKAAQFCLNIAKELEDLKAIAEQYQRQFEEAKADTSEKIKLQFAMRFGTYTDKDTVKIADVFRLLDQIAKEILEGK